MLPLLLRLRRTLSHHRCNLFLTSKAGVLKLDYIIMAKLILEHPHSGIIKQAPVGYSWTTLFFPTLPALFRGDVKSFFIQLLLDGFLILPIFIFPSIYNKSYIQGLLMQGFQVKSVDGGTLESAGTQLGVNLPQL